MTDAEYILLLNPDTVVYEKVNAKNGNASENFILKNVDFDGDGFITDSDINEVVKIIMGKAQ